MITYSLDNDNYKKKMAHFPYMEVCHHYIFVMLSALKDR